MVRTCPRILGMISLISTSARMLKLLKLEFCSLKAWWYTRNINSRLNEFQNTSRSPATNAGECFSRKKYNAIHVVVICSNWLIFQLQIPFLHSKQKLTGKLFEEQTRISRNELNQSAKRSENIEIRMMVQHTESYVSLLWLVKIANAWSVDSTQVTVAFPNHSFQFARQINPISYVRSSFANGIRLVCLSALFKRLK